MKSLLRTSTPKTDYSKILEPKITPEEMLDLLFMPIGHLDLDWEEAKMLVRVPAKDWPQELYEKVAPAFEELQDESEE